MKIHPIIPTVAICCLTLYGSLLAVLGVNGFVTVLITTAISGLGGFTLKGVLDDQKKKRETKEV